MSATAAASSGEVVWRSGMSTKAVAKNIQRRHGRPHPCMRRVARYQVTATRSPTSTDVTHGLEAFQKPLTGYSPLQSTTVPQPIACRHVTPFDRFGRLATCAVRSCQVERGSAISPA